MKLVRDPRLFAMTVKGSNARSCPRIMGIDSGDNYVGGAISDRYNRVARGK